MAIHFKCPCSAVLRASEDHGDDRGECPACGKILKIPSVAIQIQPISQPAEPVEPESAPAAKMELIGEVATAVAEAPEPAPEERGEQPIEVPAALAEAPGEFDDAPPVLDEALAVPAEEPAETAGLSHFEKSLLEFAPDESGEQAALVESPFPTEPEAPDEEMPQALKEEPVYYDEAPEVVEEAPLEEEGEPYPEAVTADELTAEEMPAFESEPAIAELPDVPLEEEIEPAAEVKVEAEAEVKVEAEAEVKVEAEAEEEELVEAVAAPASSGRARRARSGGARSGRRSARGDRSARATKARGRRGRRDEEFDEEEEEPKKSLIGRLFKLFLLMVILVGGGGVTAHITGYMPQQVYTFLQKLPLPAKYKIYLKPIHEHKSPSPPSEDEQKATDEKPAEKEKEAEAAQPVEDPEDISAEVEAELGGDPFKKGDGGFVVPGAEPDLGLDPLDMDDEPQKKKDGGDIEM